MRAKAIGYKIWPLIDPSKEEKPVGLIEPIEPDLNAMEGTNFNEKSTRYRFAMTKYERELEDWKEEQDAMGKIISHIYDTTSVSNLAYI